VIRAGDVLPADGTLVEAHDLQVDEARVTGESLLVGKDLSADVVGGTLVTHGPGVLTVTRTGGESGRDPSGFHGSHGMSQVWPLQSGRRPDYRT
jgi:magnesium-transporting ATPase (P-type)